MASPGLGRVVLFLVLAGLIVILGDAFSLTLLKKDFKPLRGTRWEDRIPEYWLPLGCIGLFGLLLILLEVVF